MSPKLSKWLTAIIAVFSLLLATALFTQDKGPEQSPSKEPLFKFSVGTNLVLVPVVVNDKQGKHISGLTIDDFEIREDGNVKKISGFEEVTAETSVVERPAVAPNTFTNQVVATRPKKLEIILLDLLNTPLAGRAEARRGLAEFLSRSTDPDTLIALLVLRSNGVQIIHNFTSDPAMLVAAVRKVQAPVSSRDAPVLNTNGGDTDAEARQLGAILAGNASAQSMGASPSAGKMVAMNRGMEALSDSSRQSQEGLLTLECMQQIARYFAAVPGRKSLLWASTGFRFSIGSMPGEATRGTTLSDWQRTIQMLQDANIAVYPVDLTGVGLSTASDMTIHGGNPNVQSQVTTALDTGRVADPMIGKHQSMDTVATMTGGKALYNNNDSAELMRRARQDSSQYYLLAYYTERGKSGWRKLTVHVHHEGAQIRARSGFFFHDAGRDPDATRQADEIMAVTSALESTALPFTGKWQQIEPEGDKRKAHFALSLPPGAVLIDAQQENHLNLDFLVLAWNAEGKEAARIGQRLDRKLSPSDAAEIQAQGISYVNTLVLPPGEYTVHVVVRDNLRGNLGSVATRLKVE